MAGSRPDVIVPQFQWTNLYTATGITTGTSLIIQNKNSPESAGVGQSDFLVFESAAAPDKNSRDGERLAPGERTRCMKGSPGVWVMSRWCEGRMFVQERS